MTLSDSVTISSNLDLADVPFVDNHAHAPLRDQPATPEAFRSHFTEAHSPLLGEKHVGSAVYFRWALRQLGELFHVEPTEEAILHTRSEMGFGAYARRLMESAGTSHVLLDEGYPPPDSGYSSAEVADMLGVRVGRMLRIETLVQELALQHATWDGVVGGFDAALHAAREQRYVALKSIAAYRSGLAVERVTDDEARRAFAPIRERAQPRAGLARLESKPVIDYFVWRAAHFSAAHRMPFQFHTGYGDPDLDLRMVNPLHLRALFEDRSLADAPIVLLHASYPYTAEAAYLCAAYPNAYLDIAFSLPPLDRFELVRTLHVALGVAPASKIMCSSDGAGIPEHYWLGAIRARLCLSHVLEDMVVADELSREEARAVGQMLLSQNAVDLYRLS